MISLYSGTPGSGKSLHAAHEIREDLLLGKNVISTMDVDVDLCFYNFFQCWLFNHFGIRAKRKKRDKRARHFHYIDINAITPEYLYQFAAQNHVFGKEHQTIVILDECVAIFSPTIIGEKVKEWNAWEDFFRKHRHLGYDVILIPQSAKLISRKVIEYCEFDIKHFNRKNHGTFGFFLSMFIGGLFSYSTCWRGVKSKPLDQGWFTYKPIYGQMYNSYCMFDSTLEPYKKDWERKKEQISVLAGLLNEIALQKQNVG